MCIFSTPPHFSPTFPTPRGSERVLYSAHTYTFWAVQTFLPTCPYQPTRPPPAHPAPTRPCPAPPPGPHPPPPGPPHPAKKLNHLVHAIIRLHAVPQPAVSLHGSRPMYCKAAGRRPLPRPGSPRLLWCGAVAVNTADGPGPG